MGHATGQLNPFTVSTALSQQTLECVRVRVRVCVCVCVTNAAQSLSHSRTSLPTVEPVCEPSLSFPYADAGQTDTDTHALTHSPAPRMSPSYSTGAEPSAAALRLAAIAVNLQ